MIIILIILISILYLLISKSKENMGSMSPKKYIIVIDMEYLAKRNKLGDQLFSFMHDNFTTAKLFLGSSKMDAVLTNTNGGNMYYKSRLESVYPNYLNYHTPQTESEFKKLVEGRTILYLGAKDDMESRNLNNRLLNAEKQMSYYL